MIKSRYVEIKSYITKDGSVIRELMHPDFHGKMKQSLSEATVSPGGITALHIHNETEEIYHFTSGKGVMTVGEEKFQVEAGDTVLIPPGNPHRLENSGEAPLKLLCCCSPPYSHEDTELLAEKD